MKRGLSGIYEIVHTATGRRYVGSTTNFGYRWNTHRQYLRRGTHQSNRLQTEWNKYTESEFEFRQLICCDPVDLVEYEQTFFDELRPELNTREIAKRHHIAAAMVRTNFYYPKEMLEKLREISNATGVPVSELIRRAITDYLKDAPA